MNRLSVLIFSMLLLVVVGCQPSEQADELPVITDANQAIAIIGEVEITGQELRDEIVNSLSPDPYRFYPENEPVEAEAVLMRMLGDQALVLDARQRGLLEEDSVHKRIARYHTKLLVNALAFAIVPTMPEVTDEEVADFQKQNERATSEQARHKLANEKAAQIMEDFFQSLIKQTNFKKYPEVCARGAQVHHRLLTKPQKPRKQSWIQNNQFEEEITDEEKALVLADWKGGKFTLADFFDGLGQFSPPSRPASLNTAQGLEQFVDRLIRRPVLETEARRRGLDQQSDVVQSLRAYEDRILLGMVKREALDQIDDPTEEDFKAYYNLAIGQEDLMSRIELDTIWMQDRATADKAYVAWQAGTDFNEVQATYSMEEKPRPQKASPQSMGLFWEVIKDAHKNDVIGPFPGNMRRQFAWRIVRVRSIEKLDYPSFEKTKHRLEDEVRRARQEELLDQQRNELLDQMPYQILTSKPEVFDPRHCGL